jgi:hypothetical protein
MLHKGKADALFQHLRPEIQTLESDSYKVSNMDAAGITVLQAMHSKFID